MTDTNATQNPDGSWTLPEVTITGSAEDGRAYIAGEQDALKGQDSDPIDRVGFAEAQPYLDGYADGQAERSHGVSSDADAPPYDGPSIGPLSAQQANEDQEAYRQAEEQRQEFLRELGQEIPEGEKQPWQRGEYEPIPEMPVE